MNFTEYQAEALKTVQPNADLLYCAAKMHIEAGETAQHVFKHIYHGRALNTPLVMGELGDQLWYITALAAKMGVTLEDIAQANIAKLRARHGETYRPEFYTGD